MKVFCQNDMEKLEEFLRESNYIEGERRCI